jgi:hypothetical protein
LAHHWRPLALRVLAPTGKSVPTFRSLVTRPGLLASNFLAGRRKSQMGPVHLFVVCNVIYFLIQPLTVAVLTAYRFVLFFTSFYAT